MAPLLLAVVTAVLRVVVGVAAAPEVEATITTMRCMRRLPRLLSTKHHNHYVGAIVMEEEGSISKHRAPRPPRIRKGNAITVSTVWLSTNANSSSARIAAPIL